MNQIYVCNVGDQQTEVFALSLVLRLHKFFAPSQTSWDRYVRPSENRYEGESALCIYEYDVHKFLENFYWQEDGPFWFLNSWEKAEIWRDDDYNIISGVSRLVRHRKV